MLVVGTCVADPTFRSPMDDKSINLWRQINGARRIGKWHAATPAKALTPPRPANQN